jgi:hypothetical protein
VLACSSSTASTHEVKVCKKQTHGSTTPGRWKSGMTSNDIRSFRWCDVTFTIFYLLQYLPTFIQNDPNCNVQGDLKLQYTQHDFQQAPRQVVAQMVALKMVLPEIGTQT